MSVPTATALMTTDELLAMPDDGMDRELVRGELREEPMTKRNPWHSEAEANLTAMLVAWLRSQPKPRGKIYCGEAGFRLRRDPDTTVGIDVAYVSAELAEKTSRDARIIDGPPALAIEILSPSDRHERIVEKIQDYLDCGVHVVWIVDPDFETVRVHRPNARPQLFAIGDELTAEPVLPGFRVAVAEIFSS